MEEINSRATEGEMECLRRKSLRIVYFLSRNGKVEHPHLIRVHQNLNSNAVHLRDVKGWLTELRGREMPGSYTWSYKRRYNAGYVWQDLTDDDLIIPISDKEYVLKGSLRPSPSKNMEGFLSFQEGETPNKKQDEEEQDGREEAKMSRAESSQDDSTITPAVEEPRAISASGCEGEAAVFKIDSWREERRRREKQSSNEIDSKSDNVPRRRAAGVLKNLLWCRTVDTKASALRAVMGNERKSWGAESGEELRKMGAKNASAMSKKTDCSQCRKTFKPEKLHSHMMSCKALKEKGRSMSFKREKPTATTVSLSRGVLEVTVTLQ